MFKKSMALIGIAATLGMSNARADGGLLSAISGLTKQLQQLTQPNPSSPSSPSALASSASQLANGGQLAHGNQPTPGSPESIMQSLADSSVSMQLTTACEPEFFQKEEQQSLAEIQSGNFAGGGTDAKLNAIEVAVCAVKRNALPMDVAEQIAGQNLAESAIALHRAGMDTPETITSAQNALTLLNINPDKNANLISMLNSSGVLPKAPPSASSAADITMTAADAASQLMANSFAFNNKYGGKTLKITGKVHAVSGGKNVFIAMDGVPAKDPGINDQATCTISNPAYTNAAMSISKGQRITVQGVYVVPAQSWLQAGVGLEDCHIIN